MNGHVPVVTDAFERILATFVVTVLGAATADGVGLVDALSLDNWKAWGLAGIVAAFTLAKTIVAAFVNRRNGQATSASLAPSVVLEPAGPTR